MADNLTSNITSKITQALGAYGATTKLGGMDGADTGNGFGSIVMQALKAVEDTQQAAEKTQAQALTGKATVTDVVQAVTEAEVTLQTFTAIRDRFISAYQDIMRMPV